MQFLWHITLKISASKEDWIPGSTSQKIPPEDATTGEPPNEPSIKQGGGGCQLTSLA